MCGRSGVHINTLLNQLLSGLCISSLHSHLKWTTGSVSSYLRHKRAKVNHIHPILHLHWPSSIHKGTVTWDKHFQRSWVWWFLEDSGLENEGTALFRSWSKEETSRRKYAMGGGFPQWKRSTISSGYYASSMWSTFCSSQWSRAPQPLTITFWGTDRRRWICLPSLYRKHIKEPKRACTKECHLLSEQVKSTALSCLTFQVFLQLRPTGCDDTFYLTALKETKGDIWYSKIPILHSTLSKQSDVSAEILGSQVTKPITYP